MEFPKLSRSVDESSDKNYNYLLGMNFWSVTEEKVEELKKLHQEKETEYNIIKDKTVETMWTEELDELKEAYETWYQLKKDDVGDINKNKSTSKKKIKNKSNKSKQISQIV